MKTINSDAGVFGPFQNIEVLDDRLRADGVDFPFTVLGNYQIIDGTPAPPPAPAPVVPAQVPALNLRLSMYAAGWLLPWEAALAALTGSTGDLARIWWGCAPVLRRTDQMIADCATALNKTSDEMDAMFIAAAALNP